MAKEQKTELAVIDFTKFSVAQLPELKGKKEEIASIIKANPIVEIVDNATYESAKKSRTTVRSLRTSLEGEQKAVKKKIKEHVLDVVDKEYDTLVLGVKSAEQSRQEPIDVWEEKKEQERQEKARLEELRVKQIKDAIQTFRDEWEDTFNRMTFERISYCEEFFGKTVGEFDRIKLAEFEVLFDDAVSFLNKLFDFKSTTLAEQEKIRIDNLLIEGKNAENRKIQSWQNAWNTNISSLVFDDITDVKKSFRQSKLEFLKHYTTEYDEIYSSAEKRLHSQIEFISKAEEQRITKEKFDKEQAEIAEKNRIAQEKFLAEKQEFKEKQLNVRTENRIKQLRDLGIKSDVIDLGLGNGSWANLKHSAINESEESWNNTLTWVKNQIEARNQEEKFEKEVQKEVFSSDVSNTEVVFEDVSQKSVEPIAEFDLPKEVTWADIVNHFKDSNIPNKINLLWSWLNENYNVPTKKQ